MPTTNPAQPPITVTTRALGAAFADFITNPSNANTALLERAMGNYQQAKWDQGIEESRKQKGQA